jgi:hypothetical protein
MPFLRLYAFNTLPRKEMDQQTIALLKELRTYGTAKTFIQIFDELGLPSDSDNRFGIALELEQEGLIQDVVYQLPLTIRAHISQKGLDLLNSQT